MIVAISESVAEIVSTANASQYASASFTPTANSLLLCIAAAKGSVGTGSVLNTSGTSLTWTTELTQNFSGGANMYLFWAKVGPTVAASVYTVDTGADPATGCIAYFFTITGYDSSLANPIRQRVGAQATATTNATATFSSAMLTQNGYISAWGGGLSGSNPANVSTPPSSWTEIGDNGFLTPTTNGSGAYRAGGETGTTVTFTNASTDWGIIIAEIFAAPLKTVNGLDIASVKTVNGLAIASIKTVNGLYNL